MLDSNLMSLLTLLSENDYLTAQTLAVKSGASSRTVQTRIGQLRAELEGHGATVESRQRHGYRLRVETATPTRHGTTKTGTLWPPPSPIQ